MSEDCDKTFIGKFKHFFKKEKMYNGNQIYLL